MCGCIFSPGDSSAFVTSPTSVFPPSASFPAPATQNAFPHESASNQEANGNFCFMIRIISISLMFSVGVGLELLMV